MTEKENDDERGYLHLMQDCLNDGYDKPSRNGGTRFLVSRQLSFNLSRLRGDAKKEKMDGAFDMILPLLTTKHVSFKLVLSELLWFLEASCDSGDLAHRYNNHIWDGNGSREHLDSMGLTEYKVGQLGPVYGWQWRRFNAPYLLSSLSAPGAETAEKGAETKSAEKDIKNKKQDQIATVIEGIKKDPWGRRHVVSAWNPEQLSAMALPPCHMMFQFIVRHKSPSPSYYNIDDSKKRFEASIAETRTREPFWLDCIMIQRSGDIPLGVPFNIASYALLTHMVARLTNLTPGKLYIQINDAHVYHNQIDGCIEQLSRAPRAFPLLKIQDKKHASIDDFKMDDFELVGYDPHPAIKFPLSV